MVVLLADAASYATIPKITSLIEQYTAARTDFQGFHLLLNQVPTHSKLGYQVRSALFSNYAGKLVPVSVHKDPRVAQALGFERPVLQYEPGCSASLDIQSVADWLLDSIEQ
jgi:cellulose biosynthesis protein BcsQ